LSLDYIAAHFARFPMPVISPSLRLLHRILPRALRSRLRRIVASGMIVISRAVPQ
jgi:hypothetical protein